MGTVLKGLALLVFPPLWAIFGSLALQSFIDEMRQINPDGATDRPRRRGGNVGRIARSTQSSNGRRRKRDPEPTRNETV